MLLRAFDASSGRRPVSITGIWLSLLLAIWLSGCSIAPDQPTTDSWAPYWNDGWMMPLDQGEHSVVVGSLLASAEGALQKQNASLALSYLDKARSIEPRNGEILLRQAWIRLNEGQAAQAEQLINRALVLTGDCSQSYRLKLLKVQILRQSGETRRAEDLEQQLRAISASGTC